MAWVECVPNVSEGRDRRVVDACARAMARTGVLLLDVSADATHHRSVYTIAGRPAEVSAAVLALYETALPAVDVRRHPGVHPRIGAVDVVPFVPLGTTPMADCVALAQTVGAAVATRHAVPVYLYEAAAPRGHRRHLGDIRRGGVAGLAQRMREHEWAPDFGPSAPHVSAGASAIGARRLLIAYNVNLATRRLDVATRIAQSVRESSGGLPGLKAIGVDLAAHGLVQVSMNLTDPHGTSMTQAFDAVAAEAGRHGVDVVESELVGLAPRAALSAAVADHVRLRDFSEDRVLERRLEAAGATLDA